ncbi:AAA family ATPase [Cloacibacterium normanense]|uniref:AAA family ATPase n=1 Tax=Cloacibacterium normanense TaxID=237258 RepID=UPI0035AE279F
MIQKIYYGTPGTGKSFLIDEMLKRENIQDENIFRVTFHPEYTYSDFIGQLLPSVKTNTDGQKEINYEFTKGIFTQALEKAYQDTSINVFLILEEMSRGDVAAIFGDIFQLLDRVQEGPLAGYSRYFVNNDIIAKDIISIIDNKIKLPPNLFIYGTVNTSDQNVFVMDTAFKRRFDWQYVSTKPVKKGDTYLNNVNLNICDNSNNLQKIEWVKFYNGLNKFISHKDYLDLGEDKQIGQFFIEFSSNESDEQIKNKIQNKLLQFLWSDIHKASFKRNIHLFSKEISSFSELYDLFEEDKNIFSVDFFDCLK